MRSGCFKCVAGEYRVDENTCNICPSGTYAEQPVPGSSGASTCRACANASDISIKGSDSESDCRPVCSQGLLLAPTKDRLSNFCNASCPSWTAADPNGMTCSNRICEAGSFRIRGVCRFCQMGYYQSQSNQTSCDACLGGRYTSEEGSASCQECNNETYSAPASTECSPVSCSKSF